MSPLPVVVIGAGLTGLVVAFRLAEQGQRVTLIEQQNRIGGQIHTHRIGGLCIELGAEGFVWRGSYVPALCNALGIGDNLIQQVTTVTYALQDDKLVPLAPGEAASMLGFQVPPEELGRGIRSLSLGMGQLVDRLSAEINQRGVHVRTATAEAIVRDANPVVVLADGDKIHASAIVVAVPARSAAKLLTHSFPDLASQLGSTNVTSNVSVNLVFDREQIKELPTGSGFIVPLHAREGGFRACSIATNKFHRDQDGNRVVVRAFFRPSDQDIRAFDDDAWLSRALRCVAGPLNIAGEPLQSFVSRWPHALPVYDDRYKHAVATAQASLLEQHVWLAGSHYHGAGIEAAVLSAERVAAQLAEYLPPRDS